MRILILSLIFLTGQVLPQNQGLYYYGVNSRPMEGADKALIRKQLIRKSETSYLIHTSRRTGGSWQKVRRERIRIHGDGRQVIYESGREGLFPRKIIRESQETLDGAFTFREYHQGKLLREGSASGMIPLHLEGEVRQYHPNGRLHSISSYRDNQLTGNQNWLDDGTPYIDSIFYAADRPPAFEYSGEFFNSYLMVSLRELGIDLTQVQDEIVIGLVIMETGELNGPIALQGKSKQLSDALIRIISEMPGVWKPAILNEKAVRYFMTLPISVSHQDVTFQNLEVSSGVLHYDTF